jgi:hypothetical protein
MELASNATEIVSVSIIRGCCDECHGYTLVAQQCHSSQQPLMMETVSETLDANSIFTRPIAQEDFTAFNIIFPSSRKVFQMIHCPSYLITKILYALPISHLHTMCSTNLIFLGFITLVTYDEQYKL